MTRMQRVVTTRGNAKKMPPEGGILFAQAGRAGTLPRHAARCDYFFSGGTPNGNAPNIALLWLCICSCI